MLLKKIFGIVLFAALGLSAACSNSNQAPRSEKPAASVEPTTTMTSNPLLAQSTPSPAAMPSNQPPNPADIKSAVARIFEKSAAADSSEGSFVTGDFNGDGAEDLAVMVKPNPESLADLNNELANWVIEDPREVAIQDASPHPQPGKPARAVKDESLLTIIHGVGAQGWRSPDARQTFMLKNVTAKMKTESLASLRDSKDPRKRPPLKGDAISETNGKTSGSLYWNGAKYSWFSISK
jgi:hypothetical protein